MSTIPTDLRERTEAWIAADPDKKTRAELAAMLDAGDVAQLSERMAGSLAFGTAGLRGRVEAGSNRMNRAVIIRTTRGLAEYLLERDPDSDRPVVVGRDARPSSKRFQKDTIAVLAAAGILVRYFPDPVPTPLVAFAARQLGARAAVVVTASHNPPLDNGYKVYDANGAQIIPPTDREIAAKIDAAPAAVDVPRLSKRYRAEVAHPVSEGMFTHYLEELAEVRVAGEPEAELKIVYTPMHGVGGAYVTAALRHFGHHNVVPVPEQYEPDGLFPTVAFPNPEEPGALDLANALAAEVDADLIIANDPDTDRLSVSVPRRDGWRPLSGNQVGALLGDYLLSKTKVDKPLAINTIVSSRMLASIAAKYGARYATTLTGFKWICNAAIDIEAAGEGNLVIGYEEALGYSVFPPVRDKDGISAAVIFADLATDCRRSGETVLDYLARLYDEHGLWVSAQKSIVRPGGEGAEQIAAAVERLAISPPQILAGIAVAGMTDYRVGAESRPRYLPANPLVELDLGARGRALVRPSGTEPKLKIYVDLVAPRNSSVNPDDQETQLVTEAGRVAEDLAAGLEL